ncbi:MAG: hypothetical protein ACRC46_07430 [Thermoguttaceae bacterium]
MSISFLIAWCVGLWSSLAAAWKRFERTANVARKRRTLQLESLEERQLLATNILDLDLMNTNTGDNTLQAGFSINVANGQYAELNLSADGGLYGYDCGQVTLKNNTTGAITTIADQTDSKMTSGVVYVQSGTYTLTVAAAPGTTGNAAAHIKIVQNDSPTNNGGGNIALVRLQDGVTLRAQVLAGTAPVSAWQSYYKKNKAIVEGVYGAGALDGDIATRWANVIDVNHDGKFDKTDSNLALQAVTVSVTQPPVAVNAILPSTVTTTGGTQIANSFKLATTKLLDVKLNTSYTLGTIAFGPNKANETWKCTANSGSFAGAVYDIAADGTVSVKFNSLPPENGVLSFTIKGVDKTSDTTVLNQSVSMSYNVTRLAPELTLGSTSVTTTESAASVNITVTVKDRDGENADGTTSWYGVTHSVTVASGGNVTLTSTQIAALNDLVKVNANGTLTLNQTSLSFLQAGDVLKLNVSVTAKHNTTNLLETKSLVWTITGEGVVTTFTPNAALGSSITLGKTQIDTGTEFLVGTLTTTAPAAKSWTVTTTLSDCTMRVESDGKVYAKFISLPQTNTSLTFDIVAKDAGGNVIAGSSQTISSAITLTVRAPLAIAFDTLNDVTVTASGTTQIGFTVTDTNTSAAPYTVTPTVSVSGAPASLADVNFAQCFNVDATTGKLTFNSVSLYEKLLDGESVEFNVTLTASDAWTTSSATQVVKFAASENSPPILSSGANGGTASLTSGTTSTTDVLTNWTHSDSTEAGNKTSWTVTPTSATVTLNGVTVGTASVGVDNKIVFTPDATWWESLECKTSTGVAIEYTVKDSHGDISAAATLTITVTPSHEKIELGVTNANNSYNIDVESADIVVAPTYTITETPDLAGNQFSYAFDATSGIVVTNASGGDVSAAWKNASVFSIAADGKITINRAAAVELLALGEAVDVTISVVAKCDKCGETSDAVDIAFTLERDAFVLDATADDSFTMLESEASLEISILDGWSHGASTDSANWTLAFTGTTNNGVLSVLDAKGNVIGTAKIENNKIVFTPDDATKSLCRGEVAIGSIAYTVSDLHDGDAHKSLEESFTVKITGEHDDIELDADTTSFAIDLNGPTAKDASGNVVKETADPNYTVTNNTANGVVYTIDSATVTINGKDVDVSAWLTIDATTGAVTIDRASILSTSSILSIAPGETLTIAVTVKAACAKCVGEGNENAATVELTFNLTRIDSFSLANVDANAGGVTILETQTADTEVNLNDSLNDKIGGGRSNWITWDSATLDSVTCGGMDCEHVDDLTDCFEFEAATGILKFKPNGKFDFLALGETATVTFIVTATDAEYGVGRMATVTFTVTGETTLKFDETEGNPPIALTGNELGESFTIGTAKTDADSITVTATITDVDGNSTAFNDFAFDTATRVVTITFTSLPPSGDNTIVFTITANDGSETPPSKDHTVTVNVTRAAPKVEVSGTLTAKETGDPTELTITVTDPNLENTTGTWYTVDDLDVSVNVDSEVTQDELDAAGVTIADLFKIENGTLTFTPTGALKFLALGEKLVFDVKFTVTDDTTGLETETTVTFTVTGETTLVFTEDDTNGTEFDLAVGKLATEFKIGNAVTDSGTIVVSAILGDGTFADFTHAVGANGDITITFTKLPPSGENSVVFTITANKDGSELATKEHTVTVNVKRFEPTVTVDPTVSTTEAADAEISFTVTDPNKEYTDANVKTWYNVSEPSVSVNDSTSDEVKTALTAAGITDAASLASFFTINKADGKITFAPGESFKFLAKGQELVLDVEFTVTHKDYASLTTTEKVTFTITGETTLDYTETISKIDLNINTLEDSFTIGNAKTDTGAIVVSAKLGDGEFTDFTYEVATNGDVKITFTKLLTSGDNIVEFTITANDGDTNPSRDHTVTVNVERLAPTVTIDPAANATGTETTGGSVGFTVTDTNKENIDPDDNSWYTVSEPMVNVATSSAITQAMLDAAGVDIADLFTIAGGKLTFTPAGKLDFLAFGESLVFDVSFTVTHGTETNLATTKSVEFTVNGVATAPVAGTTLTLRAAGLPVAVGTSATIGQNWQRQLGTPVDRGSSFKVSEMSLTIGNTTYTTTPVYKATGNWDATFTDGANTIGVFSYVASTDNFRFAPEKAYFAGLAKDATKDLTIAFKITGDNGTAEVSGSATATFKVKGISVAPTITVGNATVTTNESMSKSTTVTVADPNGREGTLTTTYSVAVGSGGDSLGMDQNALNALFTLTGGTDGEYTLAFVPNSKLDAIASTLTLKVTISVTDSTTGLPAIPKDVTFTITPSAPTLDTAKDPAAVEWKSDASEFVFENLLDHWTHDNASESGKVWTVTFVETDYSTASFADGKITFTPNDEIKNLLCGKKIEFAISYTVADSRGIVSSEATISVTVTGAHDDDIAVMLADESDSAWTFHTNDPTLGTETTFATASPVYEISGNHVGAYYALGAVTATGTNITDWSGIILVDHDTGAVTINRAAFAELEINDDAVELTVNVDATCRGGDDEEIGTVPLTFTISKFDSFELSADDVDASGNETDTEITFDFADILDDKVTERTGWATFAAAFDSIDIAGNDWATILADCFTIDENSGVFSFKPNHKFDFLAAGETAVLTFTVTVTDAAYDVSHTATITITITGEVSAPKVNDVGVLGTVTYGSSQTWEGIGDTLGATVDQDGTFVLHAISIDGGSSFVEFTNGVAAFGDVGTSNHVGTFTYDAGADKLTFTPGAKYKAVSAGDADPDTEDDSEPLPIKFQLRNVADTAAEKLSEGDLSVKVEGINTPPVGITGVYEKSVFAGETITFAADKIASDINRKDELSFFSVKGTTFNGPQIIDLNAERLKLSLDATSGNVIIDTSGWSSLTPYTEDAEGNPTGGSNSYTDVTLKFVVKDNHDGSTGTFLVTFLIKGKKPDETAGRSAAAPSFGGDEMSAMMMSMPQNDSSSPVFDAGSFAGANVAGDQYQRHLDGATSDAIFSGGDLFAGEEQWFIAKPRSIGSNLQTHESDAVFAGDFDMLEMKP